MCWKKLVTDLWKRKASTKNKFGKRVSWGQREKRTVYRIRARSARNMLSLAFLLWLQGLDHGCHHPFVPLPRRFAFHLHAMFHLAIVVHSSQEAQPPPPRQPPAQDRKGQHPAPCTPQSGGLSGRLAAIRTSFSQKPTFGKRHLRRGWNGPCFFWVCCSGLLCS